MNINANYAFSDLNRAGTRLHTNHIPLVEGKTIQGKPCVNLCQPGTFATESRPRALVSRNHEGRWAPVRSLAEFQQQLLQRSAEQRGEHFGIWTDAHTWGGLQAPDGVPQDKEVQTFASHWAEESKQTIEAFVDRDVRMHPTAHSFDLTVGWSTETHSVNPVELSVLPAHCPGKVVAILAEPYHVSQHQVATVTQFEADFGSLEPTAAKTIVHTPKESRVLPSHRLPDGCYNNNPKTYVLPIG